MKLEFLNIVTPETMKACPHCSERQTLVCQDCAETHWIPRELVEECQYRHRDDYIAADCAETAADCAETHWIPRELATKAWKIDCWGVAIHEDTGEEIGRRYTNCRQVPSLAVLYGSSCERVDHWTHWRLEPQPPIN